MTDRRSGAAAAAEKPKTAFWNDRDVRAVLFQILIVLGVLAVGWYLIHNTLSNLEQRKIATGFSFLGREAGFSIGESLIPYSPADTYLHAIRVGVINTLLVSAIGIVLATFLGTVVGIARLSSNWLVARIASVYVEGLRNIPLLLQLFFWYQLVGEALPPVREALQLIPEHVFLSQKGLRFPHVTPHDIYPWMGVLFLAGIGAAILWRRSVRRHQEATGRLRPLLGPTLALLVGPALLIWSVAGAPLTLERPELRGFDFRGGGTFSPEIMALLVGLVTYTSTFIAENVRAGILSVPKGQWEAARALGLPNARALRLIILPQALRVIVPPMTSQYLNLTKNSSLAVAIGYPDLVSILNTTINQTGQGIEGVALIMAAYLTVSLSISGFMNWYNKRIALVER